MAKDAEARRAAWRVGHEAELEARRQQRAAEREARVAQWQARHLPDHERAEDTFERESAERLGMTIEAFRELQAQRREQMNAVPSLDEQLATLKGRKS